MQTSKRLDLLSKFFVFLYLSLVTYLIFRFTKQTYGVNDDVIIQNWLSGFYTGTPELMIRGSATPKMIFGLFVSNLYALKRVGPNSDDDLTRFESIVSGGFEVANCIRKALGVKK